MDEIRIGVVGLGFIGKQHIEALGRIPGVKVVAAADRNLANKTWCEERGIDNFYEDYHQMLEEEDLSVVHDCTPNVFHWEVNRIALEHGYHVYSEKPLTLTSAEALELCKIAEKNNLIGAVNFNYRNNVMVQEMKGRILSGSLEKLTHIQAEYLQDWLLYETDFDWRILRNIGGDSRAAADIGSHCFDTIQYITGEKIVGVYAVFHKQYEKRKKYNENETFSVRAKIDTYEEVEVENEDGACILFELEGGMKGSVNISQVCAGKKNGLKVLISGTGEALEWNQENPDKLWVGHRDKGNEIIYAGRQYLTDYAKSFADLPNGHPAGWTDALTNGMKEFYRAVRNEEHDYRFSSFADGYYLAKVIEACMESHKQEKWIYIQ